MAVTTVPDSVAEEYYQINEAILDSFPKYRPPVDFFVFKEETGQLVTFSRKGERLSNEHIEKIRELCATGDLFVSRTDHPVYSKHIIKQLDLVLVDQNLKESEVADICMQALEWRLTEFFDQPVKPLFDLLHTDLMVVTQYLWEDLHRLKLFMRRLYRGDYSLPRHAINTMTVGLWLLTQLGREELTRKQFDQAAIALSLHDVGMAKIPNFILDKTSPLKPDEKEKIPPHTLSGFKIMHKLDQTFDFMRQAIMEHHERLDGSGYPQHAKAVSTFGRLTAVADAFSAMLQTRSYAPAKDPITAAKELTAAKDRFDLAISGKLLAAYVSEAFGRLK